jgi:GrpB-like predicted nucleotidyltransferase (UPF0157 family)
MSQILAEKFPTDIENYIDNKNDYIKEIDKRAKGWANPY